MEYFLKIYFNWKYQNKFEIKVNKMSEFDFFVLFPNDRNEKIYETKFFISFVVPGFAVQANERTNEHNVT